MAPVTVHLAVASRFAFEPPQAAALRYGTVTPRYLHVASRALNRWGHERSYRLQVTTFAGDPLPESAPEEKAMSWSRWVFNGSMAEGKLKVAKENISKKLMLTFFL